jgi:uncharacterized protein (UPF0332 family)
MRPGTDKLLAKSERAVRAAAAALDSGAPELAAGRAFAALLNAAKALLNERGLRLRTHARIAAALAGTSDVDVPLHEWLTAALMWRRDAGRDGPTFEEAARLVEHAQAAVAAARARIASA